MNLTNYVVWKGKDSREIKGLLICDLPPITKPLIRTKETVIDGVDGSLIEELGYASYDKSIAVALKVGADVDTIIEYFTGNGEITFSNEPYKYYKARIIKDIDYKRLLRYRTATITFRVQPFKYDRAETEIVSTPESHSMVVENIGNHTAKPIITIKGTGVIELSLNGTVICQYTFPEGDDTVIFDSEKQDAYWGSSLKNRAMTGEFPILEKGNNVLSWSSTVESVRIKHYSRWL